MSTPKKFRSPPPRTFDNYVFTKVISPEASLFPIKTSVMQGFARINPALPSISESDVDDMISDSVPIGFNFIFDGNVYDRFVACTNGWIILRRATDTAAFNLNDYFLPAGVSSPPALTIPGYPSGGSGPGYNRNERIKPSFTPGGVLICPWFDNLRNATTQIQDLDFPDPLSNYLSTPATDDEKLRVQRGFDFPPYSFDEVEGGVRYATTRDAGGRGCLVVRWRSFSTNANPLVILSFEAIIYENGEIEFRYGKTKSVVKDIPMSSDLKRESATIGIFVNDGGWHFRDMSIGLGHPNDSTRTLSKYGGAVYDPAYTDQARFSNTTVTAVYNISLQASETRPASGLPYPSFLDGRLPNWPGQDKFNGIFRMSPPLPRRRDLPKRKLILDDSKIRLPLVARTGDQERLGTKLRMYDDRKSINFVNGTVDYPTSLPRFHGNAEDGITDRQNLFGDFDVAAVIVKSNVDPYIGNEPASYISPFADHNRPEQDPGATSDTYFLTGSSIEDFGFSLKSPLKSKTQIKLELPINHALQMLETGSAIYYYNKSAKSLLMPQRGGNDDVADPLKYLGSGGNLFNVAAGSWPEDARGFGPIANIIASGTNASALSSGWSSDPELGSEAADPPPVSSDPKIWNASKQARVLSKEYGKSVQNNEDYFSSGDEAFSLPINQPFLLEKAVFEIPICVGRGWTEDRTTSSTPIGAASGPGDIKKKSNIKVNVFDFAGPAITVALFNQVSNDFETHRDLIVSGTIIPEGDVGRNIAVRETWVWNTTGPTPKPTTPLWLFEPEGFASYNSTPAAVIRPDFNGQFTGSVVVPTVAAISNGVVLGHTVRATDFFPQPSSGDSQNWADAVIGLMTSSYINVDYSNELGSYFWSGIKSIDPMGRNAKGFKPSGRSVFGKEFETLQAQDYSNLPNPLFVSSSFDDFPLALKNVLDVGTNPGFQAYFQFAVPVSVTQPSPYLIMPGDKLTLSLSKMRPAIHTNGWYPELPDEAGFEIDPWRHGLRHDVWITTGSIKMTLYGSLLREEREFHDTLNQPLGSDAIHEAIGSEPICDQHDVDYRETYYGSFSDDYITGSLGDYSGWRGRVFSRLNARNQPPPDGIFGGYEVNVNPSKSFRLQPWYERVGDQRMTRLETLGERFYDSLMPAFDECLEKDGTPIYIWEDPEDHFPTNTTKLNAVYGAIIFDSPADPLTGTPTDENVALSNTVWNWSYPFESRYADVPRQLDLNKRVFSSNKSVSDIYTTNTITNLPTKQGMTDLIFLRRLIGNPTLDFICDVDLSKRRLTPIPSLASSTGSLSRDDMSKVMYGFGDANTVHKNPVLTSWMEYIGHNHQPQFRNAHKATLSKNFSFGPVIRGWKYGVHNALPTNSSVVFRRNKFGQFRDMLEQRPDTKYYATIPSRENPNPGALTSAVSVKFVDVNGNTTSPELTWSQNLSFEVTSSVPYFDGEFKNRPPIDVSALNSSIVFVSSDNNDNLII